MNTNKLIAQSCTISPTSQNTNIPSLSSQNKPSKQKRLNIRLSNEEHNTLATQAESYGLTLSGFVRVRCLNSTEQPRIEVNTELLKSLYANERKIGGLLNQLLRHLNTCSQDLPKLTSQVHSLLQQLDATTSQISRLISKVLNSIQQL